MGNTLARLGILIAFLYSMSAHAGAVITYHGRVVSPDGQPVESNSVTFVIRVLSPATLGSCVLFEERRTISMAGSDGIFVIPIGDGTGVRTINDPGIEIEKVFVNNPTPYVPRSNYPTYPNLSCNSGNSYTPNILDSRQLLVSFQEQGRNEQFLPYMDINFVPFAVSSYDSQKIGGAAANSVMRVSDATGSSAAPTMTTTQFNEVKNLAAGTSTQYTKNGQLNGLGLPALSGGQVLGWNGSGWVGVTPLTSYSETDPSVKSFAKTDLPSCDTDEVLKPNASGTGFVCVTVTPGGMGSVTSVAPGTGLRSDVGSNAAITSSGTLSVDVGTGANQIVQMTSNGKLPMADGSNLTNVTASALASTAAISTSGDITTTGKIQAAGDITSSANIQASQSVTAKNFYLYDSTTPTPGSIGLRAPTDIAAAGGASYVLTLPAGKGTTGQVLAAKDGTGALEWISPSSGSIVSVTGTAPVAVDNSTPTAPKVGMAKATTLVDGYLSASDYNSFANKQEAGNYVTTLTGDVTSSSYSGGSVTATVEKIRGNNVVSTTLTGADEHKIYKWDGSQFVPGYISLADLRKIDGSQQAVACPSGQIATWESLTDNTFCVNISIGGSNFSAQAANSVFAGPSSGGNATPGFRILVPDDIPSLTASKISNLGTAALKNVPAAGDAGTTEVVMGTDSRLTDSRAPTDGSVTTAKIVDGAVTSVKIGSLDASKITSGVMDPARLPAASATANGVVDQSAQSFAGVKTFTNGALFNTNVGINTTNPTAGLHVHGLSGIKITDAFAAQGGSLSFNGSIFQIKNLSNGSLVLDSPMMLGFNINGMSKMVVDSTGKVGIGTATPATSAALDVTSTTGGFLPPRMTTTQRAAVPSPAEGLLVYDVTESQLYLYRSGAWAKVASNNEVSFYVVKTANQAIANGVTSYAVFQTKVYDTNSAFDLATSKFQPTVPGKYYISFSAYYNGLNTNTYAQSVIYKNGSPIAMDFGYQPTGEVYTQASIIIDLNGTTDYLDFRTTTNSPTASLRAGYYTFAQGYLLPSGVGGSGAADNMGNHMATQNINLNGKWLSGDGTDKGIQVDSTGKVGVGTATPTAALDVNGKIRGTAGFGYGSYGGSPAITTSSTTSSFVSQLSATVTVQAGDVIRVDVQCDLANSIGGGTPTYMRAELFSGPGGGWLLVPNWATVASTYWGTAASFGIYKATADGDATFRGYWHVGGGTGSLVYCNIMAQVIGKQ